MAVAVVVRSKAAAEARIMARFIDSGFVLLAGWKTFLPARFRSRERLQRRTIASASNPTESA